MVDAGGSNWNRRGTARSVGANGGSSQGERSLEANCGSNGGVDRATADGGRLQRQWKPAMHTGDRQAECKFEILGSEYEGKRSSAELEDVAACGAASFNITCPISIGVAGIGRRLQENTRAQSESL